MSNAVEWAKGPIGPSLNQAINAWKAAIAKYETRDELTADFRAMRIARSFKFADSHDRNVAAWSAGN